MPRKTKNPRIALMRLAERLGVTLVPLASPRGHYWMASTGRWSDFNGNAKLCLSYLIRIAQYPKDADGFGMSIDEVADVIRLSHLESDRGLKGHQLETVERVTLRRLAM